VKYFFGHTEHVAQLVYGQKATRNVTP